jgi:ring-1,2-phenylacetyl-CoA epoxidase subunit PaaE
LIIFAASLKKKLAMNNQFYSLSVSQVTQETPDTVSVSFEIPNHLSDIFKYSQGQYLTLRFEVNGKEERRAYSMSSSPIEKDLTVSVKRVKKGIVSNYIADKIAVGDKVEVMPPQGRFFTKLNGDHRKSYYFIAAGSGITPIFSIIKTILEEEPQSFVHLIYGNRNEESIIFKQKLDVLQTRYANQITVEHILSQPKREKSSGLMSFLSKGTLTWQGAVGRINEDVLDKWLAENPCTTKLAEYFICGPSEMINKAEAALLGNGVSEKNIHVEYFSSAATTQGSNLAGAKLTVLLGGESIDVKITDKQTILDALLAMKKDAPYSCTSGACSTCMAKVTKGTVKMDACYALDDDEVKAGYILTCQAHPTSEEVVIDYDA